MNKTFLEAAVQNRNWKLGHDYVYSQTNKKLIISAVLCAAGFGLIACAILIEYSRTENIRGMVVASQAAARVEIPRAGVLTHLHVSSGDAVEAGEIIAIVKTEMQNVSGGSPLEDAEAQFLEQITKLENQLETLEEISAQQINRLTEESSRLQESLPLLHAQYSQQQMISQSSKGLFELTAKALAEGVTNRLEHERRSQAYYQDEQKLQQISLQTADRLREIAKLKHEIKIARSNSKIEKNEIYQRLNGVRQQLIRTAGERTYAISAPESGRATAIASVVGQTVQAGTALLTMVRESEIDYVEGYATEKSIGHIRTGQEVRITYDAYPFQRYGAQTGKVVDVALAASLPKDAQGSIKLEESFYKVKIELGPAGSQDVILQSGMAANISVILNKQRLIERVLEPIEGVLIRSK